MPTWKKPEPPKERVVIEPQDIIWQIADFEIGIANTRGVTNGCECYEVTFVAEGKGAEWSETFYDHESCLWRLFTMLQSGGVKIEEGEQFEFREDLAREKNVRWVNPIGLRGHGRVKVETFAKRTDDPKKPTGRANRMDFFYTDKGDLPPVENPFE